MKTLVVNNQKGGVGKTMVSVHAAWFLAEAGAKVLVIDLDPQGNASQTLKDARTLGVSSAMFFGAGAPQAAEPGISLLTGDRVLDNVDANLKTAVPGFHRQFQALDKAWDYCVIDTPPTWSGRNYAALMVATTLLTPIELEVYSIQGVRQLLSQKAAVEKATRKSRPIDFLGLLPSRFVSTQPRQRANLENLLRDTGGGLMFPDHGKLTQRQGYAEALDQRVPVWTLTKTAAQEAGREIRGVLATMKSRLDTLPG